jgi:hypothetical protein
MFCLFVASCILHTCLVLKERVKNPAQTPYINTYLGGGGWCLPLTLVWHRLSSKESIGIMMLPAHLYLRTIKKQRKLSAGSMPQKLLSTLTLYLGMLLPAVILIQHSFSSLRTTCLTNTKDEKSNKSTILLTSQWNHECPTLCEN